MKRNGGFTLMELLIVIAIIMILAGAIVARIGFSSEKAREAKAKTELDEIASGCRAFYMDTGLWPIDEDNLVATTAPANGYNEYGASAALTATTFKGPYLEATVIPNDPWGTKYEVAVTGASPNMYLRGRATGSDPDIEIIVHRFLPTP